MMEADLVSWDYMIDRRQRESVVTQDYILGGAGQTAGGL